MALTTKSTQVMARSIQAWRYRWALLKSGEYVRTSGQ